MDKLLLSWDKVQGMTAQLARDISNSNWRPDYVVGITRGGLIPAVLLSQYFNVPMHTLKVSLRDGGSDACESNLWMAEDAYGYTDPPKNILIVDDINDTGATFNWIREDWPSGCLPAQVEAWDSVWKNNVKFAVLVENLASTAANDYSALEVNKAEHNVWVDFPWEDWWRN
jgi:hypoxanthine phosphoribosyltransferase